MATPSPKARRAPVICLNDGEATCGVAREERTGGLLRLCVSSPVAGLNSRRRSTMVMLWALDGAAAAVTVPPRSGVAPWPIVGWEERTSSSQRLHACVMPFGRLPLPLPWWRCRYCCSYDGRDGELRREMVDLDGPRTFFDGDGTDGGGGVCRAAEDSGEGARGPIDAAAALTCCGAGGVIEARLWETDRGCPSSGGGCGCDCR